MIFLWSISVKVSCCSKAVPGDWQEVMWGFISASECRQLDKDGIIFAVLVQIHMYKTFSQTEGPSMVIMSLQDLFGGSHLTGCWSNLVYLCKSEYLYIGVCLYSQTSHVAWCVYICWRGHAGRCLTVIDEQGNERGEEGGERDRRGEEKKSVRKAGYLLSLTEGFPRGGEEGGVGGLRRGKTWIHWEKTQRVWHEEKADNYLYWLKPASQHREDRKLWLDQ